MAAAARVNSLGQKLVQLTMPGVPDVYQGCELLGLSLVDPDNRRPVDFARRRSLLEDLDGGRRTSTAGEAAGHLAGAAAAAGAPRLLRRRVRRRWTGRAGTRPTMWSPSGGAARVTVVTRLPSASASGGWGATVLRCRTGAWGTCSPARYVPG